MLMSFAAFLCYLYSRCATAIFWLLWRGALGDRHRSKHFEQLHFAPVTTWLYGSISGNPVAAFPSLHSAYPLLAYLFAGIGGRVLHLFSY